MRMNQQNPHNSKHPSDQVDRPADPFQLGSVTIAHGTSTATTIAPDDLNEHFYILGRSGTGKSNLLKQLALADAARGAGLCFIDPIGSTATELVAELSRQAASGMSRENDAVNRDADTNSSNDAIKSRTLYR